MNTYFYLNLEINPLQFIISNFTRLNQMANLKLIINHNHVMLCDV